MQFLAGLALHVENCDIFGFTQNGININVNSTTGINVFVVDSRVAGLLSGINARNTGAGRVSLSIQRTTASIVNNTTNGAQATGVGGMLFSNTVIAGNGTGLSASAGGNLLSFGNNNVDANATNGTFTGTVTPD